MTRDHIEFQDRSVAKGYLITFRCYGTWLHGDERGSVDRRYHNRFGTPTIEPHPEKVARKATQYLWTDEHISQAVEYVVNGQGGELPTFD